MITRQAREPIYSLRFASTRPSTLRRRKRRRCHKAAVARKLAHALASDVPLCVTLRQKAVRKTGREHTSHSWAKVFGPHTHSLAPFFILYTNILLLLELGSNFRIVGGSGAMCCVLGLGHWRNDGDGSAATVVCVFGRLSAAQREAALGRRICTSGSSKRASERHQKM